MSIKSIRLSSGMTQGGVAERLGISRTTVSMWESGRSFPRSTMLVDLSEVLGCSVDELLRDEINNRNEQ